MIVADKWKLNYGLNFLWLLIINAVFFIFAAYLLPIRFEENDDVLMLLFASGKYSGTPEAHLVFINYVYGLFLTSLYSWEASIEWYTISFAILHITCISLIAWRILISTKTIGVYKILFLGIFYAIELRFIMLLQFTTTASLVALAGLILIKYGKSYRQWLGVALLVVAGLIRLEAALLVLLVVSPIFMTDVIVNRKIIASRSLRFLLAALFVMALMKFVDYRSYQENDGWKYYKEYNKARGKINDNPYAFEIEKPGNVSSADYMLLLNFFPDAYTLDLKKISSILNKIKQVGIKRKIANILPSLENFYLLLIVVFISCGLLLLYHKDKGNKWILLLSLVLFVGALFYITSFGTIKARVFLSAVTALFFVIYVSSVNEKMPAGHFAFSFSIGLFVLIFLKQTFFIRGIDKSYREIQFSQQKKIMGEYLQDPTHTVIVFANNYAIQFNSPFSFKDNFKSGQLYFSGWLTNNPLNKTVLDSYLDLVDRRAIFFRKNSYKKMIPLLQESILTNYGLHVQPEVEIESDDYLIIKLKKV